MKTYPVDPARKAAWKVKNREHVRKTDAEYRQRNRDAIVAYNARYREANPQWLKAYYNAYNARRRAAECRATPAWADQKKIAEIYETAVTLTLSTGIEHDVDHIVPLRSKRVCGLHVEHNLRPFPSRSNAQKGNRWWPDGPDDISLPASYDAHALR